MILFQSKIKFALKLNINDIFIMLLFTNRIVKFIYTPNGATLWMARRYITPPTAAAIAFIFTLKMKSVFYRYFYFHDLLRYRLSIFRRGSEGCRNVMAKVGRPYRLSGHWDIGKKDNTIQCNSIRKTVALNAFGCFFFFVSLQSSLAPYAFMWQ